MDTATAERRSPSPPPSPKKQQKRPRWRKVDSSTFFTFPSSKRVYGFSHHSDPNNNPTTSDSDWRSSHYKSKSRVDHHRHERPNAKAEGAPSSSSASVWVRVSDKPPTASTVNIIRGEDLEASATSPGKCIPHRQQQNQQNCQASHMDMDNDQEDGAVECSSDEGCAVVDVSQRFTVADPPSSAKEKLVESDPHKLCQRQKQIDYGRNTLGYERYLELVPRKQRKRYVHPQTPNIRQVCSKRSWDGQVKKWRRRLHEFDPPASENEEAPKLFSNEEAPKLFSSDNGYDGSSTSHSQEEKDATSTSGSEGNPKEEAAGVSTIYDNWDTDDAVEP